MERILSTDIRGD